VSEPQTLSPHVPQEVSTELQRVAARWRQLPLERALLYSGRVRALVQSLADEVAKATGAPAAVVPDCGPVTLMDQLIVLVYDASADSGGAATVPGTSALGRDLVSLRRELI